MQATTRFGAAAAFLIVSCAGALAGEARPAHSDYWPMRQGNRWTYRLEAAGQAVQLVQTLVKIEKRGDEAVGEIESEVAGQVVAREEIASTAKGVFRHGINGMPVEPAFPIVRLPVKKGDAWDAAFTVANESTKASVRADEEDITVPAGTYKAVTIDVEVEISGQRIRTKYWLARDVGVVKQTIEMDGTSFVMELEKAELAK